MRTDDAFTCSKYMGISMPTLSLKDASNFTFPAWVEKAGSVANDLQ
jgi:hypothetical protein